MGFNSGFKGLIFRSLEREMKQKKMIKTSGHEYITNTAATGYLQSFIKAHSSVSACALSTVLY